MAWHGHRVGGLYRLRSRRAGFTLIELLVVVAIVLILLGLLLPAIGRARSSAVRIKCQANLRSVHQLLHVYATDYDSALPLGYRGGRMQWNTMVYSGFGAGNYVLFGRMERAGLLDEPEVLYCPAEKAPAQQFNTPENPWPPGTPGVNVQGGYASAPFVDWGFGALTDDPPRLDRLGNVALLADGVGLPDRVNSRHEDGVQVLYVDGGVSWIWRDRFNDELEQCIGLDPSNNALQSAIWAELDAR